MKSDADALSWRDGALGTLVYGLLALLSLLASLQPAEVAPLWLANAWGIAWLNRLPPRAWGPAVLACMLANAAVNLGLAWGATPTRWAVLSYAPADGLEMVLGAALLHRFGLRRGALRAGALLSPRAQAVVMLVCLGVPGAGATLGAGLLYAAGMGEPGALWISFYAGTVLGLLALLPLLLARQASPPAQVRVLLLPPYWAWLCVTLGVTLLALASLETPFVVIALPLVLAALNLPWVAALGLLPPVALGVILGLGSGLYALPAAGSQLALLGSYCAFAATLMLPAWMALGLEGLQRQRRGLQHQLHALQQRGHASAAFVQGLVNWLRAEPGAALAPRLDTLEQYARLQRAMDRPAARRGVALSEIWPALEDALAERLRDHRLHLPAPPELRVLATPEGLQFILQALLANAMDYARSGRPLQWSLQGRADGGVAQLRLEDNGSGLSDAQCRRLGEPFVRWHAHSGAGLSLALAQQLAEHFDGELRWLPRSGGGLSAELRLPLA